MDSGLALRAPRNDTPLTNSSVAHSAKFEHSGAVSGIVAESRFFSATKNQGILKMLKFYFNGSPNPTKVALFLEEAGIAYQPVAVDTRAGDQFKPEYLAINPNAKVPAIDDDGIKVFDSNAILLYLAEKTGKFLPPTSAANRAELLSWLMFVATGVGPYSGQAVHFRHFSPEKIDYAHNRYQFEAQRHFGILNDHLAKRRYMVGDTYTIVDMDVWGWARMIPFIMGEDAFTKHPSVKRLVDEISARPAAAKAIALKDNFKFKAEMDDEARSNMFKHLAVKAA
jgi:GST-like protein